MKTDTSLDYNRYYKSILTEKNPQEIKATQFLNFLSDLVLKYKSTIDAGYSIKGSDN